MEDIVDIVKTYGPVITIGLGVLSATPPVYKTWIKPLLVLIRDAMFRDKFEELEAEIQILKTHRQSRTLHLSRNQHKLLRELAEEREP